MNTNRSKFIFFLCCSFFFLIILRLFFLQVVNGKKYESESEMQRESMIETPSNRGLILSSDFYPLSENKIGYVLNFDKNLRDKNINSISNEEISKLVEVLTADSDVFLKIEENDQAAIAKRKNNVKKYIESIFKNKKLRAGVIYKKITEDTKNKIEKLKIPELFFTTESLRFYPEASMSANVLGFLGRDENDKLKGYFGLEGYYDRDLKGVNGYEIYEKDPLGRPILLNLYRTKDQVDGRDLLTSIDRSVQRILEKWILWGVQKYEASSGTAILYDPYNGEIIGLAQFPSFNPNVYFATDDSVKKNSAVSDVYEPGSIMKPLVMSAAMNEGLVNRETRCPKCAGPREMSGYFIHTFDDQYLPNLTMKQVLERSDNTGMTYVGELLGKDKLLSYFSRLGFGALTSVDLDGEAKGYVKKKHDIYDIDQATMTFGQGISVSSIQMIKAWGALVTGYTVRPHIVRSFINSDLQDKVKTKIENRIYSQKTVDEIPKILVDVVNNSPEHFARDQIQGVKNYNIAAKSGTAQIPLGGKYAKGTTIGSVIGFAPAFHPKYILLVKLDGPQANQWGANTAGPIFFNIWNELFKYYNIPPQ